MSTKITLLVLCFIFTILLLSCSEIESREGWSEKINLNNELHLVISDPEKSVWILANILYNAIRYLPLKGTIKLLFNLKAASLSFQYLIMGRVFQN